MEAVDRLELKAELLRAIDKVEHQLNNKADRGDITTMANEMHNMKLDQAERNRSLRDSVGEVERAIKTLAALVAEQPGANRGGRFSLREFDPRILIVAALAVGAAGGKAVEAVLNGGL